MGNSACAKVVKVLFGALLAVGVVALAFVASLFGLAKKS